MKEIFKKKAYLGYLTVGDGGMDYSVETALAYVEGGVDIIEIGIPFTDPVADGPTIQAAMERSLRAGTTPKSVLTFVERFRKQSNAPLVLFSYYNPVLQMGEGYLRELKRLGVQAMILVDVPYTEVNHLGNILEHIPVITPSSTEERIVSCTKTVESFVYYACQKGTTGARQAIPQQAVDDIHIIKNITTTPVVAGFGISSREMAQQVLETADGFVVGSHFVKAMESKTPPQKMAEIVKGIDPRY
jgi:tryptophan synthase alpha chain